MGEQWDVVGNVGEGAGSRHRCYQRRSGRGEVVSLKIAARSLARDARAQRLREGRGKSGRRSQN